jgi:NTE family protein
MTQSSRRNFLKTLAISSVAIAGSSGLVIDYAQAQMTTSKSSIDQKAAEISKNYFLLMAWLYQLPTSPQFQS